jgi:hypothetical protein
MGVKETDDGVEIAGDTLGIPLGDLLSEVASVVVG